jgi:hypothetical protein
MAKRAIESAAIRHKDKRRNQEKIHSKAVVGDLLRQSRGRREEAR